MARIRRISSPVAPSEGLVVGETRLDKGTPVEGRSTVSGTSHPSQECQRCCLPCTDRRLASPFQSEFALEGKRVCDIVAIVAQSGSVKPELYLA